MCGGSLIKKDKVLTAAHCCLGATSFEIYLGTNNEKVVRSERTTIHEHFNQSNYANNICIIHLDEEVDSGEGIATIRLPSRSACSATFERRKATVSGWGFISKNETAMKVELMHADVIIMHNDLCRKIYEQFTAETLCAASSSFDCFGEFAGQLTIIESDGEETQVGIASHCPEPEEGGCGSRFPDVYTRITEYLDWIEEWAGVPMCP
ncbi:collagenase-like [Cloeon dipterum]|uniref:collagenase-like n=1 Tax=Cloeon dipterum TaxID=197152 RepID=UPI003220500D